MMDQHIEMDARFEIEKDTDSYLLTRLMEIMSSEDKVIFVAKQGQEVVGYAIGSIMENMEIFRVRRYGFVVELTVDPDMRRRSVGRKIWNVLRQWFLDQKVDVAQLYVSVLNKTGEAFWQECGFEDFVKVMWRDLKNDD